MNIMRHFLSSYVEKVYKIICKFLCLGEWNLEINLFFNIKTDKLTHFYFYTVWKKEREVIQKYMYLYLSYERRHHIFRSE